MRRRSSLAVLGALSTLGTLGAAGIGWPATAASVRAAGLQALRAPEPVVQVAAGGPTGVLAVGASGTLFALPLHGGSATRLAEAIDPGTPLAVGHGRIAARRQDGALWVLQAGAAGVSDAKALAPAAGLLVLPLAVIGVQADGARHRVVRLEPSGAAAWAPVARSVVDVLPDARPLQADVDGSGDGGHVVVLAGPDAERYRHGVLGDAVEATRLCVLERHGLELMRQLVLPPPHVLEDIAPRRVPLGSRDALLTVRAGPQGAQLVLVDADPAAPASLRIAASGAPIGTANRWLSPTTDGRRWMAVHTPHLGGVLHEYRRDGAVLRATHVADGLSNHALGSRRLDLCAWQGPWLLVPDQARQRLLLLDSRDGWRQAHAWALPSRLVDTAGLGDGRGVAVLLEDGGMVVVRPPG
jgi:hypothetical protein